MFSPIEASVILVGLYFLPTIVAFWRGSRWRGAALVANVFGFTVIGWFAAWIFAAQRRGGEYYWH